jgi:hypothetical protein
VASDTPNSRNQAANKRIDAAQAIPNAGTYGWQTLPVDRMATLVTIDFQSGMEF